MSWLRTREVDISYFEKHYSKLSYPIKGEGFPGFRRAQLGALHSIASHFTVRREPAIVTMPTGSGKTAVLISSSYLLRATNVLVITPSRMVREQIAEQFSTLDLLRDLKALPARITSPKVFTASSKITSSEQWLGLKDYDVVVASVPSISPAIKDIPAPPEDLFDLILVDEAHHSPARTWQSLLDHFPVAHKVLFTATPFRNDQRGIQGRFIYSYSLKEAHEDEIFGEIHFKPVEARPRLEESDRAIALAAQERFLADRETGLFHLIMVRTDTKNRAKQLARIYEENTDLRLQQISGNHTLKHIKKVIYKLRSRELDGVICVDMLGEGFDLPNLKIAAIHSPHKSLAVTLQFIGRFARTTGTDIGSATFIATPSDIQIETEKLYHSQAVWQDLVTNLSAARVERESSIREALESFEFHQTEEDINDISLYSLRPYYHVKIYRISGIVDIRTEIDFPRGMNVLLSRFSERTGSAIYITREVSQQRWTDDDRLNNIKHDLFVIHFDSQSSLLFICASRRNDGMYEHLIEEIAPGRYQILSLERLNKTLSGLGNPTFFNVGMRNRVTTSSTESYRIISGSGADRAILPSDGRLYHRGHCFGSAMDDGESITIGLSSGSKIWSNTSSSIPELIQWCGKLAAKISSDIRNLTTNSGLDLLATSSELQEVPDDLLGVDWPPKCYLDPPVVRIVSPNGDTRIGQLLDFDLHLKPDSEELIVVISDQISEYHANFRLARGRLFSQGNGGDGSQIFVQRGRNDEIPLLEFLNERPLIFYTAELSSFEGVNFYPASTEQRTVFDLSQMESKDWDGIDIMREVGLDTDRGQSLHAAFGIELQNDDSLTVVYYDHGSGEVADFISMKSTDQDRLLVSFFHCKGSGGDQPGDRVNDVYEVCSQAVKSVIYARRDVLRTQLEYRFNNIKGSAKFLRGDIEITKNLLTETSPVQIDFEMVVLQPGVSRDTLSEKLSNVIEAANDYLIRGGFKPLRWIGS